MTGLPRIPTCSLTSSDSRSGPRATRSHARPTPQQRHACCDAGPSCGAGGGCRASKRTGPSTLPPSSAWVQRARALLLERDRADIGDEYLGQLLSGSRAGADGAWPREAVRSVGEATKSKHLDTSVEIGRFNARGVYRHLDKNHAQRQPDKSTRPRPVTGPGTLAPPPLRSRQRRQARQWRGPARSASVPASSLPRWPALPADTSPPAGPKRSGNARISRSSGSAKTAHPGRSASTGTARAASPTSNAAPLNARTAATALSSPAPSSISSASTIRTSPRRSAPGSPATDGNSNPNRYVPPTAIASRTDSGSCTNPRHRPACSAPEAGPGFREDELAGGGQVWPCSTCSLLLWMRAT